MAGETLDIAEAIIQLRLSQEQLQADFASLPGDIARQLRPVETQAKKSIGDSFKAAFKSAAAGIVVFNQGLELAQKIARTAFSAIDAVTGSVAREGDVFAKTSQKYGIAVEDLSGLKLAADLADVSLEQLGTGLGRLARNMLDTSQGTGEAKDAFRALKVDVTEASGALRSSQDVLLDLADRFSEMKDGPEKAALAIKILGRAGADMIPLFNGGSKAIREQTELAERLGIVFSTKLAKQSEELNDSITIMGRGFDGVKKTVAAELIPILTDVVKETTDWLVANRELIAAPIKDFLSSFIFYMRELAPVAGASAQFILNLADSVLSLSRASAQLQEISGRAAAISSAEANWRAFSDALDETRAKIASVKAELATATDAPDVISLQAQLDELETKESRLIETLSRKRDAMNAVAAATDEASKVSREKLVPAVAQSEEAIKKQREELERQQEVLANVNAQLVDLRLDELADENERLAQTFEDGGDATAAYGEITENLNEARRIAEERIIAEVMAMKDLTDAGKAQELIDAKLKEAQRDYADEMRKVEEQLRSAEEAHDVLNRTLDVFGIQVQVTEKEWEDLTEAYNQGKLTVETLAKVLGERLTPGLRDTAEATEEASESASRFRETWKNAAEGVSADVSSFLGDVLVGFEDLNDLDDVLFDSLRRSFSDAFSRILQEKIFDTFFKQLFDVFEQGLDSAFSAIGGAVSDAIGGIFSSAGESAQPAVEGASQGIGGLFGGGGEGGGMGGGGIAAILAVVYQYVTDLMGALENFSNSDLPELLMRFIPDPLANLTGAILDLIGFGEKSERTEEGEQAKKRLAKVIAGEFGGPEMATALEEAFADLDIPFTDVIANAIIGAPRAGNRLRDRFKELVKSGDLDPSDLTAEFLKDLKKKGASLPSATGGDFIDILFPELDSSAAAELDDRAKSIAAQIVASQGLIGERALAAAHQLAAGLVNAADLAGVGLGEFLDSAEAALGADSGLVAKLNTLDAAVRASLGDQFAGALEGLDSRLEALTGKKFTFGNLTDAFLEFAGTTGNAEEAFDDFVRILEQLNFPQAEIDAFVASLEEIPEAAARSAEELASMTVDFQQGKIDEMQRHIASLETLLGGEGLSEDVRSGFESMLKDARQGLENFKNELAGFIELQNELAAAQDLLTVTTDAALRAGIEEKIAELQAEIARQQESLAGIGEDAQASSEDAATAVDGLGDSVEGAGDAAEGMGQTFHDVFAGVVEDIRAAVDEANTLRGAIEAIGSAEPPPGSPPPGESEGPASIIGPSSFAGLEHAAAFARTATNRIVESATLSSSRGRERRPGPAVADVVLVPVRREDIARDSLFRIVQASAAGRVWAEGPGNTRMRLRAHPAALKG